jgi:hypothetical protein
LAAAGCTGTELVTSGNAVVRVNVTTEGEFVGEFDCVVFQISEMWVRPIGGVCAEDNANAGDACLDSTDCMPGTGPAECEGSFADEIVGINGIVVVENGSTVQGDLWNGPCAPENPLVIDNAPELITDVFVNPDSFILSQEVYEISQLQITNVALYKDGPTLPEVDFRTCLSPGEVLVAEVLGDALRFTVPPGGQKVIQFVLHLDKLEQFFQTGGNNCFILANNIEEIFTCETCDAGVP